MKNKKIIFCIDSLGKGGAERVVSTLANELSQNNQVSIITLVNEQVAYELNENVNLIELGKLKYNSKGKSFKKVKSLYNLIYRTRELRKCFNRIKPDIIISFLPEASFLTVYANRKKYKLIISDRNDPNHEYQTFIYKKLVRILYPKADGYVFQTFDAKNYFNNIIDFKKKKYEIIVNPVNEKFINYPISKSKEKKIVSVGRLTEQKNIDLLIDSFSDIEKDFPEYTLTIYGDGNMREHLSNKIKSLNLENKIAMPGIVNNIQENIIDASLFVMSSDYEGIPNALIEAMTLGLPVISTDCPCGGPRMFIENEKNGFLIPVGSRKELANTMKKVLSDDNLKNRIGKNAKDIVELVNPSVINSKWAYFINAVIGDDK
mgnify:FL=1